MEKVALCVLASVFAVSSAMPAEPSSKDIPPPADLKNVRLGLWEETIRSEQTARPQVDMSKVDMSGWTPEQKARVEAVLKRQHEEQVAQGSAPVVKSKTKRFCVKAGDVNKSFNIGDKGRGGGECKETEVSRSSSRLALRYECAGESAKISTELSYEVKSPTETVGEIHSKGTMMGRPVDNSEKATAHWVGPECGSVSEGPNGR